MSNAKNGKTALQERAINIIGIRNEKGLIQTNPFLFFVVGFYAKSTNLLNGISRKR